MGFKSTCRWIGGRRKQFATWVATLPPPSVLSVLMVWVLESNKSRLKS